jgi:hypothetical protein
MARKEPSWAELVGMLITLYISWVASTGQDPFGPAFWYYAHRASRTLGQAARELERYLHRKYLDSVMH